MLLKQITGQTSESFQGHQEHDGEQRFNKALKDWQKLQADWQREIQPIYGERQGLVQQLSSCLAQPRYHLGALHTLYLIVAQQLHQLAAAVGDWVTGRH